MPRQARLDIIVMDDGSINTTWGGQITTAELVLACEMVKAKLLSPIAKGQRSIIGGLSAKDINELLK